MIATEALHPVDATRPLAPVPDGHCPGSRRLRWLRDAVTRAQAIARGPLHPPVLTLALVAIVVVTARNQGVFGHDLALEPTYRWGFSGSGLLAGHLSTLASSQFLTRDAFMAVSIPLSLIVMLGTYELIAGTVRATVVAVVTAIAGPGLVTAVLAAGSAAHVEYATRTLATMDYGASAMTAGGGGALVAIVRNKWLTRFAVAFVLSGLVLHHEFPDWEHLVAVPVGAGLGWLLDRRHPWRNRRASRAPEPNGTRRSLRPGARTSSLAALALASATGALIANAVFAPAPPSAVIATAQPAIAGSTPTPTSVPDPSASPLRLVDARYPTPSMGGDRRVLVVLPAGYDSSTNRYPVVEILHGRPGGPDNIVTSLELFQAAVTLPPFIAIAPDGHGPVVSDGDFADTSKQKLGAALGEDLQRWVDTTYRTTSTWAVMGLSAGGYGAAYLATRPATHYAGVCSLAGYFQAQDPPFAGEPQVVRDAASPILHVTRTGPRTLLIAGRSDQEGIDWDTRYSAAMTAVSQENKVMVIDGGHDWGFFSRGAAVCLHYLLAVP